MTHSLRWSYAINTALGRLKSERATVIIGLPDAAPQLWLSSRRQFGMKKSDVLALLEDMPDDIDTDKLIYTLFVRRKIEVAEASSEHDDLSLDEVDRLSEQWLE